MIGEYDGEDAENLVLDVASGTGVGYDYNASVHVLRDYQHLCGEHGGVRTAFSLIWRREVSTWGDDEALLRTPADFQQKTRCAGTSTRKKMKHVIVLLPSRS